MYTYPSMKNKGKLDALKAMYEEMQANLHSDAGLHNDIKYIIRIAQFFGLFPLTNVLDKNFKKVHFKWLSFFTFYAIFCIFGTLMLFILSFVRLCLSDFKLHLLDSSMFCLFTLVISLVFYQLAMHWSKILRDFNKMECMLKSSLYRRNLKPRFLTIVLVVTAAMFLEHSLAIANTYLNMDLQELSKTNNTRLEQYFREEYPFIFDYVPYSLPLGLLVMYINTCNVFYWSFIDSFIMIMSYALSYRFKQINVQLKLNIKKKHDSTIYWSKIRDQYTQTAILCQKVNKKLSNVILVSMGANMYFIITQLYKGLVTRKTIVDQCYFIYSFSVLVLRTVGVIMYGSMVHSQSKKPLNYLVSIKNEAFNHETRRFIMQVYTMDTFLSGGQYFILTKSLLFQMVASIITYELFMVQAGISIYI